MKLLTTYELHYVQYKDAFFDPKNFTGPHHFSEQLDVFDKLVLVARCKEVMKDPQCQRADSDRIEFFPVTDFSGYKDFTKRLETFWDCRKTVGLADRYWLRAPGFMASMVGFWLRRAGIPYFSHLVGNIGEVAEVMMDGFPKPLRKLARSFIEFKFKRYMKGCHGTLSVTEQLLQQLYPSALPCNDFGVSDVKLPDSLFSSVERNFRPEVFNIVTMAALLPYKGHKFLLEALSQIKTERSWRLHLVGEGYLEGQLRSLSEKLGIRDNVVFHGHLGWSPGVMEILDSSHLFVLSSLTEGMPRVVLEAMAMRLPVISTDVGGVSEVINPEWLVPIKNSDSFATKISMLWKNPELLEILSSQNYNRIQAFRFDRLSRMRREWLTWMKLHGHEAHCVNWKDYCKGHKFGFLNNA